MLAADGLLAPVFLHQRGGLSLEQQLQPARVLTPSSAITSPASRRRTVVTGSHSLELLVAELIEEVDRPQLRQRDLGLGHASTR